MCVLYMTRSCYIDLSIISYDTCSSSRVPKYFVQAENFYHSNKTNIYQTKMFWTISTQDTRVLLFVQNQRDCKIKFYYFTLKLQDFP